MGFARGWNKTVWYNGYSMQNRWPDRPAAVNQTRYAADQTQRRDVKADQYKASGLGCRARTTQARRLRYVWFLCSSGPHHESACHPGYQLPAKLLPDLV